MNILVTGSTGFLGKNLCFFLKKNKYTVIETTKNINEKNKFYLRLGENIDIKNNLHILNNADVIIHCAFDFTPNTYDDHYKINIVGSKKIFELSKKFNIKIIHISSISAFKNATSIYGKVKYNIENLALNFNAINIRPGLIYGQNAKGMFGKIEKLVNFFPILPLINFGNQIIFPCKIEILIILINKLITLKDEKKITITAASENKIYFKDLIKIIAEKQNKKIYLIPFPSLIIYFFLNFNNYLNLFKGIKKDNLTSILNINKNPDFMTLRKINIEFPNFNKDYK